MDGDKEGPEAARGVYIFPARQLTYAYFHQGANCDIYIYHTVKGLTDVCIYFQIMRRTNKCIHMKLCSKPSHV